jgi:mannose-6-phosphate isomerase
MSFTVAPHQQKVPKPWGFEVIYTPAGSRRVGKILFVKGGKRLSLQYHDAKEETLCLLSGKAVIWLENGFRVIEKITMEPMKGYNVQLGQKHRIEALEDSFLVETSDPELGNTFRIDDDYVRTTETEELRTLADRGWAGK